MSDELLPIFPSRGSTRSYDVPEGMIGSKIVFMGSKEDTAELVIDYDTRDGKVHRIILGFSELGMWIEQNGFTPAS